jgi:hypothetical protein
MSKNTKRITVCLSEEEWEELKLLSELHNMTVSEFARMVIQSQFTDETRKLLSDYEKAKVQGSFLIAKPFSRSQ